MKTWAEIFAPTGFSLRAGQQELGDRIIEAIENKTSLIAQASTGSGKSFATSIPTINKINECRSAGKPSPRSVISTETITLQNQLCDKDLPFLESVYGGFTYAKLLGRSNYLCMNRFRTKAVGNREVGALYKKISAEMSRLTSGEYSDVCALVGYEIDKELWKDMVGTSDDCSSNNDCKNGTECYGTLARKNALASDIVVVNHALLGADYESKSLGSDEGILGDIDILVVDECHKLEDVLSSQWSKTTTEWEVNDHVNKVLIGSRNIPSVDSSNIATLLEEYQNFFTTALNYFVELTEYNGGEWKGAEVKFAIHHLYSASQKLADLMDRYEALGPSVTETVSVEMGKYVKEATEFVDSSKAQSLTKAAKKDVKKSISSAKFLSEFCEILNKSLETKDGVVFHRGTTYGVIADGWIRRKDGSKSMTVRCFPIDISGSAEKMFSKASTTILMSATLTDLTDGSFKYFKRSIGMTNAKEIDVKSPFNMDSQQLVYVTPATRDRTGTSYFSVEEMVDLINASGGRTLVLFTSRYELELAKNAIMDYKIAGMFPYTLLSQDVDSDKMKLAEEFKADTTSVLLGLKSFATGFDVPGESLSQVILARWPLPRYSTETRMRMAYWRSVGFPKWYERESLTVFQQSAGRLIRSDKCIGAVSLLDQRAFDATSNVFRTARVGVDSLGSRVVHDPADISAHIEKVEHATV